MKRKRYLSAILVLLSLLVLLAGCKSGDDAKKSAAVSAAEDAISAIGEVDISSGDSISKAEKLYNILTDAEKAEVGNRLELVDAREAFDALQGEAAYANAKDAYEKLNEVAKLCCDGMDDIYGSWHFGIYGRSYYSLFYNLSEATPHFTSAELEAAANSVGITEKQAKDDWQKCVTIVECAILLRGDYDTIETEMAKANDILQELTTTYGDYTYYPKLKEYYSAVSSYVEFFKSPSGSFEQLADTINSYENNIRTLQSDVGFLFNK